MYGLWPGFEAALYCMVKVKGTLSSVLQRYDFITVVPSEESSLIKES